MKIKFSLILWIAISVFLIVWLGQDLVSGVFHGEISDLRTGNELLFEARPLWFTVVFFVKLIAILACAYFLFGASQILNTYFRRKFKRVNKK